MPRHTKGDAGDDGLTGTWDRREQEAMADRVEARVERYAPGFRELIRGRRILAPPTLQSLDANLHGGAINGGTTALHQQLVFRPTPGAGRPETPSGACTSPPPAPIRAAAYTARPVPTPPVPHCAGPPPVG